MSTAAQLAGDVTSRFDVLIPIDSLRMVSNCGCPGKKRRAMLAAGLGLSGPRSSPEPGRHYVGVVVWSIVCRCSSGLS
jgi:hypothetical protein